MESGVTFFNENIYSAEWLKMYKKRIQQFKAFYCNGTFPYRSFSPQVVEFIFKLADECGLDDTVKYTSVDFYDRFLSEYFILKHKDDYKDNPKKWLKILEQSKKQFYLRILSCMQIMSKFAGKSSKILKVSNVKAILKRTGHLYTIENILSSEAEVLHTVGYKLNVPSTFILVKYFIGTIPVKTADSLYSTCLLISDFVYINQQELYDRLQYQVTGYRNCTYSEKMKFIDIEYDKITTAAVVVLTAFYILDSSNETNKELCEYLSNVCEKSVNDLYLISSVLLSIINAI